MPEAEPVISVIAATCNRARSLRALLASLDRSTPPPVPYEIVAVDNGSGDETSEILREWAAGKATRRVLPVDEPGRSGVLNSAIAAVNGQTLSFLDDDAVVEAEPPGRSLQILFTA